MRPFLDALLLSIPMGVSVYPNIASSRSAELRADATEFASALIRDPSKQKVLAACLMAGYKAGSLGAHLSTEVIVLGAKARMTHLDPEMRELAILAAKAGFEAGQLELK